MDGHTVLDTSKIVREPRKWIHVNGKKLIIELLKLYAVLYVRVL